MHQHQLTDAAILEIEAVQRAAVCVAPLSFAILVPNLFPLLLKVDEQRTNDLRVQSKPQAHTCSLNYCCWFGHWLTTHVAFIALVASIACRRTHAHVAWIPAACTATGCYLVLHSWHPLHPLLAGTRMLMWPKLLLLVRPL
eukprot:1160891-Pelagomonas_calceolata.AAC.10